MQSKYFAKRTARNGLLVATALACLNAAPAGALAGDMVSVPSDAALAPRGATLLGTTPASQTITVAVTLPGRDPAGARAFVAALGTPGNALFHHYLSPAEYAARFGAPAADYAALVAWAQGHALTVGEAYTARTVLPLSGTVAAVQAAFGVNFNTYKKASGTTYYAADRAPVLPADIAGKISGVIGLSS